jgi:hypothetical protein
VKTLELWMQAWDLADLRGWVERATERVTHRKQWARVLRETTFEILWQEMWRTPGMTCRFASDLYDIATWQGVEMALQVLEVRRGVHGGALTIAAIATAPPSPHRASLLPSRILDVVMIVGAMGLLYVFLCVVMVALGCPWPDAPDWIGGGR